MTVFVSAHSLTTTALRRALVVHGHAVRDGEAPRSITTTDSREANGGAFVMVNGPESWSFHSVGLTPAQAVAVASAIEAAS